jgi:hypothetical protein
MTTPGHLQQHIAGGSVQAAAGLVCLSYGVDDWAAFFLTVWGNPACAQFWLATNVPPPAVQPPAGGHDTEKTKSPGTVPGTWIASPQVPFTSLTTNPKLAPLWP